MSINNPTAVINALTANIIKLESDNFDLKARLKESREKIADLKASDKVSSEDYEKLVEELTQAKEAAHNRPQHDCLVQEHPLFIEWQKQTERANERIAELEEQLSAERCAAGYLRNYFIKFNQDAIPHLCDCVVGFVKDSDRSMRVKGGILALSPINHVFSGGRLSVDIKKAIEDIKAL